MCHYTVTAKDKLPEIVETYPFALVCNTHNADQPGPNTIKKSANSTPNKSQIQLLVLT